MCKTFKGNQNKTRYQVRITAAHRQTQTFTAEAGANLLDICRQQQIPVEAACNGRGICGKCRVQVIQGNVPAAEEERRVFTAQEIADGYRLACRVRVMSDLTVRLFSQQNAMEIQMPEPAAGNSISKMPEPAAGSSFSKVQGGASDVGPAAETEPAARLKTHERQLTEYCIAVDLGSTTLAAVLIDQSGSILSQVTAVNSQRAYGGDVISRIQASNEGRKDELRRCICRDLEQMFCALVQKLEKMIKMQIKISRVAIAGNTTMLHLLRGYSCERLGQAPFEPVNLQTECLPYRELFSDVAGCVQAAVYLLPGMSAFAGADITAGLYSSGFWQMPEDETAFFVDLGTNGELACGSRKGFVTSAAAAGPAFEGGRLSCGIPGIPGAVSKVSYLYHRVRIQTIGQKKPCGICGTGALEAVAALLGEGLLNKDGLLAPQLFEQGMVLACREDGSRICLTQADIREIQMAKAAIRAGIEILLLRYGQMLGQDAGPAVSRVYLAGGFGYYLSADTATAIGLFPPEWRDKIILCGNTSLKGAVLFLSDPSCAGGLVKLCSKNTSIQLEDDPRFQEIYIQQMGFGNSSGRSLHAAAVNVRT